MTQDAAGRVLDVLRARIVAGDLGAGRRLHQAELADELGVSRIPVRDALQALSGEGLVELNGRSGATVAGLSVVDLQELYELREAVEPVASRLAVPNLGRADLLRMEQRLGEMARTIDWLAWLEANTAFHAALFERSNRPRMVRLVRNLRRQTDRYLHRYLTVVEDTARLDAEHRGILAAARGADPAAVEALTRAHLETSHEFLLHNLLEHEVMA